VRLWGKEGIHTCADASLAIFAHPRAANAITSFSTSRLRIRAATPQQNKRRRHDASRNAGVNAF